MPKRLERFFRSLFLRSYNKEFCGLLVDSPDKIITLLPTARILLLRHDKIGDVLVSEPCIRVLGQSFPQSQIDILLSTKNSAAHHAVSDYVNSIKVIEKNVIHALRQLRELRSQHYDLVIDMLDNASSTSTFIIERVRAKAALGFMKSNAAVYTHTVPLPDKSAVHIVERTASLLNAVGIYPTAEDLHLHYNTTDCAVKEPLIQHRTKPVLFINISGSRKELWWGRDNYISFIRHLPRHADVHIVVGSSPDYAAEARVICTESGALQAPFTSSFHDYACLIRQADYLLSPDTSVVHLGSAFGIPTVAMYIQNNPALMPWYPYRVDYRSLSTTQATIASGISVEDVVQAMRELIDAKA